jgi:hypothetical protein
MRIRIELKFICSVKCLEFRNGLTCYVYVIDRWAGIIRLRSGSLFYVSVCFRFFFNFYLVSIDWTLFSKSKIKVTKLFIRKVKIWE